MDQYQKALFQSTLPARGATVTGYQFPRAAVISIHAPRTGSDEMREEKQKQFKISIHAPRTGSDGISGDIPESR